MIDQNDINIIKEVAEEFFQKMTIEPPLIEVDKTTSENQKEQENNDEKINDVINLNITLEEPQILIGEKGQTLFEIQRLLRAITTKKIQKVFYLNLDINKYKQNKIEYLKKLSKELADQVSLTKEEKPLFPMPSYERRVIHAELMQRPDVITESRGEGVDRYVVIKPR
ncbi:MAG: R3H domain-containing nucleic acid-binding protein [Candidatus Staskawiczbacteria bacterium]|nr:R3H domain-containing nucleic acid-binding protein [Candidatus Staskawiczbacteria bacterium]